MSTISPSIRARSHPFKLFLIKSGGNKYAAIPYHSRLFTGMTKNSKYLSPSKIAIEGLDDTQLIPKSFPGKNFYCVLEVDILNLNATKAKIVWVQDDKSVENLNPVVFDNQQDLRQIKARAIIGVLVNDKEAVPASPAGTSVKTSYVMQFVHTDLMMCNMVFDGVPVILPVPFIGGRLNF
jgi:hypothetical protein